MWPSFVDLLPIYGLAALALTPPVAADYYVDNANSTVAYAGTNWQTFSFGTRNLTFVLSNGNITVDSSKCYDQNYALAACTVANNCQITFPFTGSGVTIFILHAGFQGITASLTIDGGQSVTTTLPPPTAPSYQTPNVSLFSVQSLATADHTAAINLLDWENGTTSFYFDYALVNESAVEAPASPSTSSLPSSSLSTTSGAPSSIAATSQPSTTQSTTVSSIFSTIISTLPGSTYTASAVSDTSSSVNLGTVVGGACGGLAALIAIVTAVVFLKNRKSLHAKLEDSRRPDPFPVTTSLARDQMVSLPACPEMDPKARMRLAAVYQSRRPSADESSDFHIHSTGDAGRRPGGEAGPSTADPFSSDDFVIECRRENSSPSNLRGSVAQTTASSALTVDSVPPPGYQTVESRRSNEL